MVKRENRGRKKMTIFLDDLYYLDIDRLNITLRGMVPLKKTPEKLAPETIGYYSNLTAAFNKYVKCLTHEHIEAETIKELSEGVKRIEKKVERTLSKLEKTMSDLKKTLDETDDE